MQPLDMIAELKRRASMLFEAAARAKRLKHTRAAIGFDQAAEHLVRAAHAIELVYA